jgi:hypothetical protein
LQKLLILDKLELAFQLSSLLLIGDGDVFFTKEQEVHIVRFVSVWFANTICDAD